MALGALAFNDLAGQRETLATAAWYTPLGRDAESPELAEKSSAIRLSSAFAGAHDGVAYGAYGETLSAGAQTAALDAAQPRTIDREASGLSGVDALSVLAARGTGVDRKVKDAALAGTLSGAFHDAQNKQSAQQAPAISPAQQAFLNKLNSDPDFANAFRDNVNKVTTALDQPSTEKINSFQTVRPDFDLGKHDETVQQNYCQADDAKCAVEELKNMMDAHAEDMKASGPADPMQPPGAVPTPVQGEFTMSAQAAPSTDSNTPSAATGMGSFSGNHTGDLAKADPGMASASSGYTGANAAAPQASAQTSAQPAGDGRLFIHGPGLTDEGGKSRVAMTHDGKLEIDGMGLDDLESNVHTIHRDSKMAAEVVDSIATKGVTTGIGEAVDLVKNGGVDANSVNVANNGTAHVFQLAGRRGPGGMA
jgi:hypothetical protein